MRYDSIWDWTLVSRDIVEYSNHFPIYNMSNSFESIFDYIFALSYFLLYV